jgi:putative NADPH-quinone reductase
VITIVYAHPLVGSLNAAILNALTERLRAKNQPYHLIDLYKDGFQPAMTPQERQTFFTGTGESGDPLVQQYQAMLKETEHLVCIFPIWFNTEPSILRGFFERTCLPGFGYAYTQTGPAPLLTHIQKLTVLTTSGAPTEMLTGPFGNMIEKQFINFLIRNMIGPIANNKDALWLNLGGALSPKESDYTNHIARVTERFLGTVGK